MLRIFVNIPLNTRSENEIAYLVHTERPCVGYIFTITIPKVFPVCFCKVANLERRYKSRLFLGRLKSTAAADPGIFSGMATAEISVAPPARGGSLHVWGEGAESGWGTRRESCARSCRISNFETRKSPTPSLIMYFVLIYLNCRMYNVNGLPQLMTIQSVNLVQEH